MAAARSAPPANDHARHGHDGGAAVASATPPSWPAPPGYGIVRMVAPLVPRSRRDDWLAEWAGELAWAWGEAGRRDHWPPLTRLHLRRRALGAAVDAFSLRRRHGAPMSLDLDLRHAARVLRRRPGFVTVVVLTLALGIGATTAIFSVVNGVLLRPLPLPAPERLVRLDGVPTHGNAEKVGTASSYPDFIDIRAQTGSIFDRLAAVREWTVTLTSPGTTPSRLGVVYATPGYLATLGLRPLVGRDFTDAEALPGAPAVTMIGRDLWRQRYGGDPAVLGRTVELDGVATTIIGVMPPDARLGGSAASLWQPLVPGEMEQERGAHRLTVIGRLRPGVTLDAAQRQVSAVARRLAAAYPADNEARGARLLPLRDSIVGASRPALLVLLGAVALVLLIGCTNLASLFLARAAAREHEMAVRAALGAGTGHLVRQWMAESLLLSLAGGLLGLAVAWAGMRALLAWAPGTIPRASEVTLDLPVLGFLLVVSVLTGLLFGILPAWQQHRAAGAASALGDGARGSTHGRASRRLRELLVVAEVALATVLVIGATLLVKNVWQLQGAPMAVRPDGVMVARLQLPVARYDSVPRVLGFYDRLRAEVAALPGVRDVAVAYENPASAGWTSSYTIVGRERPAPGTEPEARVRPVAPGYFRAVGLPLLAGRDVDARDRLDTPGVVVVNEAFVRRHFRDSDPIGRILDRSSPWWPGQPTTFTIVGVVADEPFLGRAAEADPATYYAHSQFPMADMWLVVRADGDPAALASAIRARVWRVDPDLPVERVAPLGELLGESVTSTRFNAALLTLFALAALLLAAIGVYGVLSYTVAQRTREIGVRLALGAPRGQLVRQVVARGMGGALLGIAVGIAGALGASRALSAVLVGVSARDPAVFVTVAVLLSLVAAAAAWLPARRASRVDPALALRQG
ncbi:MAG: ABC transporter permease [Gemmatimonadaceae bacterium]